MFIMAYSSLLEFIEMMMLLSSVLIHVLLHLGVGVAQFLDQLPPIVLLIQVSNILKDESQKSAEGRIFSFICSLEGFLNNIVSEIIQNDFISLHGASQAAHKAYFS